MLRRPLRPTLFPYTTLFRSSVVLATRRDRLEDVRSVALDTSSRTSAALVEIIFREFVGRAPRLEQSAPNLDRKSTRLNSSHRCISYAVFCLNKKKNKNISHR